MKIDKQNISGSTELVRKAIEADMNGEDNEDITSRMRSPEVDEYLKDGVTTEDDLERMTSPEVDQFLKDSEDQSNTLSAIKDRYIASNSAYDEAAAIAREMGWDQPEEDEVPVKVREKQDSDKYKNALKAAKAKDMEQAIWEDPMAAKENMAGQGLANIGLGMVKAIEGSANLLLDIADGFENIASEYGYGSGKLLGPEDRLNLVDRMFPTDDPADKVARGIGQYLVPLGGWMAVAKAKGYSDKAAILGAAVTSAAITDPTEGRLSDFLNEIPEARGFVIDALTSKEDDSALMSRAKTFAESVLFDAGVVGGSKAIKWAVEGFSKSVTAMRNLRKAKEVLDPALIGAVDDVPPVPPKGGNPDGKIDVGTGGKPKEPFNLEKPKLTPEDQKIADEAKATFVPVKEADDASGIAPQKGPKPPVVDIDTKALQESMDIKEVLAALKIRGEGWESAASKWARRGTISDEQAVENATQLLKNKDKIEEIFQKGPGSAFNQEEALAVKYLALRETTALTNLLTEFNGLPFEALTEVQKARFIEQADRVFHSMQVLQGAMAEGGRTLRAFGISDIVGKIPDDVARLEYVKEYVKSGGRGRADMYNSLNKLRDPKKLITGVAQAARRAGRSGMAQNMLHEYWVNNLLGFKVQAVNVTENVAMQAVSNTEGMIAQGIGNIRRMFGSGEGAMESGQILARIKGQMFSVREAFKNGYHVMAKEQLPEFWMDKFPDLRERQLNGPDIAWVLGMSRDSKAVPALDAVGQMATLNLRSLKAQDVVSKTMHYRGALAEQAHRVAIQDGFQPGTAQFEKKFQELITNPTDDMLNKATEIASEHTFTSKLVARDAEGKIIGDNVFLGQMIEKIGDGVNSGAEALGVPVLGKFITTFGNIAGNLTDVTLQRIPGFQVASPRFRAKWAAGGAERDQAIAQTVVGTLAIGYTTMLSLEGGITGSRSRNWREQGALGSSVIPPYHIKVGDKWYPYNTGGPIGSVLGMGADIGEMWNYVSKDSPEPAKDLALSGGVIIADTMTPEFITNVMGDFIKAHEEVSTGKGGKALEDFLTRISAGFFPMGANVRDVTRELVDPTKRDKRVASDAPFLWGRVKNEWMSMVGMGDKLPEQLNMWGEVQSFPSGASFDEVSPTFNGKWSWTDTRDVVDKEIERLRLTGPILNPKPKEGEEHLRLTMPLRYIRTTYGTIEMSPEAYNKYVKLSAGVGEEFKKATGLPPLKEALAQEIKQGWPSIPTKTKNDEMKKLVIQTYIRKYREAGRKIMMMQEDDILDQIREMGVTRQEALEAADDVMRMD